MHRCLPDTRHPFHLAAVSLLAAALLALAAPPAAPAASLEELSQRLDALAAELEARRAPARPRVTVGGYGEAHYNNFDGTRDDGSEAGAEDLLDLHRFVLFFGYRFSDTLSFRSEVEIEHALASHEEEDPGEVEMEQAYVEWAADPHAGLRGGLLLVPAGILNETHEPPTFFGVERNRVETRIIPTTWRELGVQLFGEILLGLRYQVGLHSGLELPPGADARGGLRGTRQGAAEATAERLAASLALRAKPVRGLSAGLSLFYQGDLTQGAGGDLSALLSEAHARYRLGPLEARALYARWDLDGAEDFLAETGGQVATTQQGWYLEAACHLARWLPGGQDLAPFVRHERLDTNHSLPDGVARDPGFDERVTTVGLNYWPVPQVVLKADVQDFHDGAGTGLDRWNLGIGWWF
ncbi:MAG: porin [Nitrospirae bacterium]|nr:MAG: porin [Nitrospirota bacterium]